MNFKENIKVVQVFEEYPAFYQPYIPPVINKLRNNFKLDLKIHAYKGVSDKDVSIIPSYYYRRVIERLYALFNRSKPKLNYAEIKYLKDKIDIVHLQHSFLFPKVLGLLKIPKNKRPKILITLRGGDTYVKPWIHEKWLEFYKNEGNKVDAFIVMSEHQKMYLQKWGISKENIHVIPISFGDSFGIKPKFPNPNKIKIISAFRMCWEKNIEGNLLTIKLLKEKGFPIQYDIYGDGPDLGQLFYLIDKYKISDVVNVKGKVDNKILKNELINYDFFLQLSYSESFGVSVVEAQSYGVPAIVSNSDGLPEAIMDKESGYCVNPWDSKGAADLILSLWNDANLYYEFSKKAIDNSHKKFTIKVEAQKLFELYSNLING